MIVIGILLSFAGIGFLCWLVFTLSVYALPFFAGVAAGLAAFHTGAGPVGAIVVGVVAAIGVLAVGQVLFALARSPLIRALIALAFAAPAAFAGYQAVHGLAALTAPSEDWRVALAVIGALVVGAIAWTRMSAFLLLLPTRDAAEPSAPAPTFGPAANDAEAVSSLWCGRLPKG